MAPHILNLGTAKQHGVHLVFPRADLDVMKDTKILAFVGTDL